MAKRKTKRKGEDCRAAETQVVRCYGDDGGGGDNANKSNSFDEWEPCRRQMSSLRGAMQMMMHGATASGDDDDGNNIAMEERDDPAAVGGDGDDDVEDDDPSSLASLRMRRWRELRSEHERRCDAVASQVESKVEIAKASAAERSEELYRLRLRVEDLVGRKTRLEGALDDADERADELKRQAETYRAQADDSSREARVLLNGQRRSVAALKAQISLYANCTGVKWEYTDDDDDDFADSNNRNDENNRPKEGGNSNGRLLEGQVVR